MSEGEIAIGVGLLLLVGAFFGYIYGVSHKSDDIREMPKVSYSPEVSPLSPWSRNDRPPPPPMPRHKPSKHEPTVKVINTTSHPCTVTVTSMGPSEYHITLSDTNAHDKGHPEPLPDPDPSHKHYKIILAWRSGKEIQIKTDGRDWRDVTWDECYFLSCNEYRIKPKHPTIGE